MKRILLYLFVLVFTNLSCSRETIPQKELSLIIADLYLADGVASANYSIVQKSDSVAIYESIINMHGYTIEEFKLTINKLVERPGKLMLVYENAKKELVLKQKEISSQIYSTPENSAGPIVMGIVYEIDQGREIDRYKRAFRWLTYPNNFIHWKATFSKSEQNLFEEPRLAKWWVNSVTGSDKPIYK